MRKEKRKMKEGGMEVKTKKDGEGDEVRGTREKKERVRGGLRLERERREFWRNVGGREKCDEGGKVER